MYRNIQYMTYCKNVKGTVLSLSTVYGIHEGKVMFLLNLCFCFSKSMGHKITSESICLISNINLFYVFGRCCIMNLYSSRSLYRANEGAIREQAISQVQNPRSYFFENTNFDRTEIYFKNSFIYLDSFGRMSIDDRVQIILNISIATSSKWRNFFKG